MFDQGEASRSRSKIRAKALLARWRAGTLDRSGTRLDRAGRRSPFHQIERSALEVHADLDDEPGFRVILIRWMAKRTFSCIGRQRRLSQDDERFG